MKTKIKFVHSTVAYNTNEPLIEQLLQVYQQKTDADDRFFWSYLSRFDGPKWFTKLAIGEMAHTDYKELAEDKDLQAQVSLYRKLLDTDLGIVAVAHSQGNFYINEVQDLIRWSDDNYDLENLQVVSVATPDHSTFGKYITLTSDAVIRAIPYAMPANCTNLHPGLIDHEFIKSYLDGNPSGDRIVKMIDDAVNTDFISDGGPNYQKPGYLDNSLHAMRQWMERLQFQPPRTFTPVECLAVALFLRAEFDTDTCTDDSLASAQSYAQFCYQNDWSKKDPNPWHPECSLPGYDKEPGGYGYDYPSDEFVIDKHAECNWKMETTYQNITPAMIKKALDFIAKP